MDEDFELELELEEGELVVPPSRGRRDALQVCYARDLDEADIRVLIENPGWGSETPGLKELRHSHHRLAQLLASGTTAAECHLITGYSASRISILQNDPAFQELLSYYVEQEREIFVNVHQRMSDVGLDVLQEIQHRIEDAPEKLSMNELLSSFGTLMDRSGYGPKSTLVHEAGGSMKELLAQVKEEIRNRTDGNIKTLDVTPTRSEDRAGTQLGDEARRPALAYSERQSEGNEGERQDLREGSGSDVGEEREGTRTDS